MSKFSLKYIRKNQPWKYIINFANINWGVKPQLGNTNMEIKVTKAFRAQTAVQFPIIRVAEIEQQENNMLFSVSLVVVHKT